ncbi:hypothetical protein ACH5RR_036962 [Cinchona calisaya]|uniref:RNase H type-1 domain-containing protein n=1 Tax=Cinchona calisaya TaxID=153742 RepID=A0ABD2Y4U0_9GENT
MVKDNNSSFYLLVPLVKKSSYHFEGKNTSARWIIMQVETLLDALSLGHPFDHSSSSASSSLLLPLKITTPTHLRPVAVKWIKPPNHTYMLNEDGSTLGNPGSAGICGIIGDSSGEVQFVFAKHIGSAANLEAESQAL